MKDDECGWYGPCVIVRPPLLIEPLDEERLLLYKLAYPSTASNPVTYYGWKSVDRPHFGHHVIIKLSTALCSSNNQSICYG
jgi:hypothetical protein